MTAIIYSVLVIKQYTDFNTWPLYYGGTCTWAWPCLYYYSRFVSTNQWMFTWTNLSFVIVGLTTYFFFWL